MLLALALLIAAFAMSTAVTRGWDVSLGPLRFSSRRPYQIVSVALWLAAACIVLDGRVVNGWKRRSPFLFYLVATVAMLLFALGPTGRVFGERFLWKAPYSWLMLLPGGGTLRVPSRFAMLFALCLGQAAALAWTRLIPRARVAPLALAAALAVLADGWAIVAVEKVPRAVDVAALGPAAVLLEWPITNLFGDTKALLNATMHGRTMVNGYSGYSPPHYGPLASGTRTMDAHVLDALRQARPLGIYIDPDRDADGRYRTLLEAQPGVTRVASSTGALFVLPALHTDDSQP